MSNTRAYYETAKAYQDQRKALRDAQAVELAKLEKYKGSDGYRDEVNAIREKYAQQQEGLKAKYAGELYAHIDRMKQTLNGRTYKAPTEEQLRLLQVLQMKEKPTHEEFERTANSLKDCPVALSALQEKARSCGEIRDYITGRCQEMPSNVAEECIKELKKGTADFLNYDTKRAARVAAAHNERLYGTTGAALPLRDSFDTEAGCFAEVCRMNTEAFESFAAVVNSGGTE